MIAIDSGKRKFFGLILVIIGLLILLHNVDFIDFDWDYFWPTIIILVGAGLIVRATTRGRLAHYSDGRCSRLFGDRVYEPSGEVDGTVYDHFIGDIELNLGQATLKYGTNNLHLSAFIGSIKVLVPQGIAVRGKASVTIGDITVLNQDRGGLGASLDYKTPDYDTADKKINIEASMFIGDIRIRRN